MDTIAKNIADLLPKTVDEIITKNRDKIRLRIAVDQDFDALPLLLNVIDSRPIKSHAIEDWQMIRLEKPENGEGHSFIVGYRKNGVFITSAVKAIEYKDCKGLLLTKNSLYRLGEHSDNPLKTEMLLHICASLWVWGFGGSLGVLPIFY